MGLLKMLFNKKRDKTLELFDHMYKISKDNNHVHSKEEFVKILEKPIINHEIGMILKSVENKIR